MPRIDELDLVEDYQIANSPIKFECKLSIIIPLEAGWQESVRQIEMFFELNFSGSVSAWEVRTIRIQHAVKLILYWTSNLTAPYMLRDIDNTIKEIIRNNGLDTTTGISGTTWNRSN